MTEEEYKKGNYILTLKTKEWFIANRYYPTQSEDFAPEFRYIHKKHKAILDAYLLDNDVEIEQCSNGDWYEININPYYDAFIRFYDENNEYRLKHSFEEQLINEVIGNGVETIKAPNSDIKFLNPAFECEILKEIEKDRRGVRKFIGTYRSKTNNITYPCVWFETGEIGFCSSAKASNTREYDLIPYKEKKEWYEDESNFPTAMTRSREIVLVHNFTDAIYYKDKGFDLADNEEIDQLKVKQ